MSQSDLTAEAPAVTDAKRDELLGQIRSTLGDAVVESLVKPGDDVWVRVRTDAWRSSLIALRESLGFDYFCFLSAIDWLSTRSTKKPLSSYPWPPPVTE